jgi:hypothetical protein
MHNEVGCTKRSIPTAAQTVCSNNTRCMQWSDVRSAVCVAHTSGLGTFWGFNSSSARVVNLNLHV